MSFLGRSRPFCVSSGGQPPVPLGPYVPAPPLAFLSRADEEVAFVPRGAEPAFHPASFTGGSTFHPLPGRRLLFPAVASCSLLPSRSCFSSSHPISPFPLPLGWLVEAPQSSLITQAPKSGFLHPHTTLSALSKYPGCLCFLPLPALPLRARCPHFPQSHLDSASVALALPVLLSAFPSSRGRERHPVPPPLPTPPQCQAGENTSSSACARAVNGPNGVFAT